MPRINLPTLNASEARDKNLTSLCIPKWLEGEIVSYLTTISEVEYFTGTDEEVRAAESDVEEALAIVLNGGACYGLPGGEFCQEYQTDSHIIAWAPNDPFQMPNLTPPGYEAPPWSAYPFGGNLINDILAYQSGDVIFSLFDQRPSTDPFGNLLNNLELISSGFPRFQIRAFGPGVCELHLLKIPFGGQAYITVDNNPAGRLVDMNSFSVSEDMDLQSLLQAVMGGVGGSLFSLPVEIIEVPITGEGEHQVDVTFIPNLSFDGGLGWGGGLRKVVLCQPTITGVFNQDMQLQRNGLELEWRPNPLASWQNLGQIAYPVTLRTEAGIGGDEYQWTWQNIPIGGGADPFNQWIKLDDAPQGQTPAYQFITRPSEPLNDTRPEELILQIDPSGGTNWSVESPPLNPAISQTWLKTNNEVKLILSVGGIGETSPNLAAPIPRVRFIDTNGFLELGVNPDPDPENPDNHANEVKSPNLRTNFQFYWLSGGDNTQEGVTINIPEGEQHIAIFRDGLLELLSPDLAQYRIEEVTAESGETAQASYDLATKTLALVLPRGERGETGAAGQDGQSIEGPPGPPGQTGATGQTGAPGQDGQDCNCLPDIPPPAGISNDDARCNVAIGLVDWLLDDLISLASLTGEKSAIITGIYSRYPGGYIDSAQVGPAVNGIYGQGAGLATAISPAIRYNAQQELYCLLTSGTISSTVWGEFKAWLEGELGIGAGPIWASYANMFTIDGIQAQANAESYDSQDCESFVCEQSICQQNPPNVTMNYTYSAPGFDFGNLLDADTGQANKGVDWWTSGGWDSGSHQVTILASTPVEVKRIVIQGDNVSFDGGGNDYIKRMKIKITGTSEYETPDFMDLYSESYGQIVVELPASQTSDVFTVRFTYEGGVASYNRIRSIWLCPP